MARELLRIRLFGRPIIIEYVGGNNGEPEQVVYVPVATKATTPLTIVCPHCGRPNAADRETCKGCGLSMTPPPTEPIGLEARRAVLNRALAASISRGWTLIAQTDTTATLTKKGDANGCMVLILLCLAILPGILYFLFARPVETIFIQVDEYGRVSRTMGRS